MKRGPLTGVRVLDFSTLLPGPLATLLLAEAGAEVIKIERPGRGDEMRSYTPKFGADSVNFALLNRGKRSIAIDLKDKGVPLPKIDLAQMGAITRNNGKKIYNVPQNRGRYGNLCNNGLCNLRRNSQGFGGD